jgi:AraC-like DNA-binding protein/quercetin dioxygenase-like cupin family protein
MMNSSPAKQTNASAVTLGSFNSDQISVSLSDYHGGLKQSWHSHEDTILTFLLKGHVREQVGGSDVLANPLSVGIKPAGLRHTDHFCSKGLRAIRLTLPHSFVSELKNSSLINERWDWITDSQAIRPFLQVGNSLLQNESCETAVTEGVYEILATFTPVRSIRSAPSAPLWLRRAQEHLNSSFADGIRLTALAGEADVHPVYFARQFRRFFGCAVGDYVRRLQFQTITSMLAARQYDLAQIAGEAGFSDQAHMTRVMATEFGITPGHFRKLLT